MENQSLFVRLFYYWLMLYGYKADHSTDSEHDLPARHDAVNVEHHTCGTDASDIFCDFFDI